MIDAGCLCFDIGAHYGETAEKFLTLHAGRVISVEACRENNAVLSARFEHEPKVTTIHAAVSSLVGFAEIRRSFRQTGLSTIETEAWQAIYPDIQFGPVEVVPAITLDMLRERYGDPHIVKIDVEGHELSVLQGMTYRPPFVTFEFHGQRLDTALACLDRLRRFGFSAAEIYPSEPDYSQRPSVNLDEVYREMETSAPEWGNITAR